MMMRLIRALILLVVAAAVFDGLWFIKTGESQIARLRAQFSEEYDLERRDSEPMAPVNEPLVEPQPGYVAYDPPSVMEQGETYQIMVRIGTEALREELLKTLSGSGVLTIDLITATPLMSVRLEGGDDFDVQPFSSEVQWLTASEPTQWLFDVTALQAGKSKILRFFVSWQVVLDGNPTGRDFEPFVREIEVMANRPYQVKQFVLAYFELTFAVTGGLFGFLFRRLFERH